MALIQEPIIFKWRDEEQVKNLAPNLNEKLSITLLINPETLTLNFKKIITKTRTKSRIVSFYWGQEPVNFSYAGQTGNLFPSAEIRDKFVNESTAALAGTFSELDDQKEGINYLYQRALSDQATLTDLYGADNYRVKEAENNAQSYKNELDNITASTDALRGGMSGLSSDNYNKLGFGEKYIVDNILTDKSHTDIISLSPKFQRFKELEKFYNDSQNLNLLIRVIYRDYVLDGYFESFGFTDSALSPWNWKYTLAFTVLNWDNVPSGGSKLGIKFGTNSDNERILVPDESIVPYSTPTFS